MVVERTTTGVCPSCGLVKGLRADGTMATHSVGVGEARHKCFGVRQRPTTEENDDE